MAVRMVAGWDVGGVNVKRATAVDGRIVSSASRPFAIQHAPNALPDVLRTLWQRESPISDTRHAVTMTAELSQMFRTKREGVSFVLDAFEQVFPSSAVHVYLVDGRFVSTARAREEPLRAAASNWHATALLAARHWPDATLVDIGSTTTDVIPIANGKVVAQGRTDPDRLATGELLYLGAVRTPVEAIVSLVPVGRGMAGVSAEAFALAGDVHTWHGDLPADTYDADATPTPDGRPTTREFVRERLARIVCADREMLDDAALDAIARHIAEAQTSRTAEAVARVRRTANTGPIIAAGIGAFLVHRAAALLGMPAVDLASALGEEAARIAPAAAVALLLASDEAS